MNTSIIVDISFPIENQIVEFNFTENATMNSDFSVDGYII